MQGEKEKEAAGAGQPCGGQGEGGPNMATGVNCKEGSTFLKSLLCLTVILHHCKKVEDILVEVGIACEVVVTTHAGHARFSHFISRSIVVLSSV